MPWVGFATKTAWDIFHDAVCASEGVPRAGRRQSDGEPRVLAQWTTAMYSPYIINVIINDLPRKIGILRLPQAVVNEYSLNVISDPVNNEDGTHTVTYNSQQYVVEFAEDETNFPFRKNKPSTVQMDGKTYDTATGEIIG